MGEEDELLDLVNADDQVVGTVMREQHHENVAQYNERGEYWRGTGCFLVNSQNQIWVPKRQPWRKVAPGSLDFSMAEHVQSGESHLEGAVRGMKEELNLELKAGSLILLGKNVFKQFGCVMSMYVYRTDDDPDYSKDDYQSAEWMDLDSLRTKIASGVAHKTALPEWLDELERWLHPPNSSGKISEGK